MQRELVLGPPPGFRKAIPALLKLEVVLLQRAKCAKCGTRFGTLAETQFDHVPAIQLRIWDPVAKDTVPPSNSILHIEAKHVDCHAIKTFGTKATKRGADVTEIARLKRLTKGQEEFRRRILAKSDPDTSADQPKAKPKKQWPSRPFPNRKKGKRRDGSDCRHDDGLPQGDASAAAGTETPAQV